MSVQVPGWVFNLARQTDGEYWPVLLALAQYESTFDPNAVGDGGCSIGLLQFNRCGGLGQGHSIESLKDPAYNLRLGSEYIRGRIASGASLYDALQPWSVRPQAWELYQRMQGEGVTADDSSESPVMPGIASALPIGGLALGVLAILVLGLLE